MLRLIQTLVPESSHADFEALLADAEVIEIWQEPVKDERVLVRVLVEADKTEAVLDAFENRFAHLDRFRAIVMSVEATIPRVAAPEPDPKPAAPKPARISRGELLSDLEPGTRVTPTYIATVVLSAIVATTGLLRDNVAIIIGAMVIAPLLTPNMALALATTLGDPLMIRKSLRSNAIGVGAAFLVAVASGLLLPHVPGFTTQTSEFMGRTEVWPADIVLALASGGAGALAFTAGVPAGLVGVMVAVALLPPIVVCGIFISTGAWSSALGAALLLATNVICVNLAAVLTFSWKGVRPRTWWEADKARRATRRAFVLWTALLIVLVVLIWLS